MPKILNYANITIYGKNYIIAQNSKNLGEAIQLWQKY